MRGWIIIVLVGCGSDPVVPIPDDAQSPVDASATDGSDANVDASDGFVEPFPAFPSDYPQVVSSGGPTLKDPVVVPIFFSNEDPTKVANVMAFLSKLPMSTYWSTTTAEYGVASITIAPKVSLVEAAPATITNGQIDSWLTDAIAKGKVPPNSPQKTIYTLYYPQSTKVDDAGLISCVDFGGYHGESNGAVYAVIAGCSSYSARLAPNESIVGIDFTTGLTTHELVEAATDPYYNTNPAYRTTDLAHKAWNLYLNGGEIADTCELEPHAFYKDAALGAVVQRMWSNQNAQTGHDPCVPVAGTPWVSAFAAPSSVSLSDGGVTIPIHLVSDAPTNGFNVQVFDYASEHNKPAELSLSLDHTAGKNGDTLQLSVQLLKSDPSTFEGFIVETDIGGVRRRTAGIVH
jgi:hypothetical protein